MKKRDQLVHSTINPIIGWCSLTHCAYYSSTKTKPTSSSPPQKRSTSSSPTNSEKLKQFTYKHDWIICLPLSLILQQKSIPILPTTYISTRTLKNLKMKLVDMRYIPITDNILINMNNTKFPKFQNETSDMRSPDSPSGVII